MMAAPRTRDCSLREDPRRGLASRAEPPGNRKQERCFKCVLCNCSQSREETFSQLGPLQALAPSEAGRISTPFHRWDK